VAALTRIPVEIAVTEVLACGSTLNDQAVLRNNRDVQSTVERTGGLLMQKSLKNVR